ncbi:MAG: hypothetical protein ACJ767_05825 [Chloroflexota bacterium]
MSDIVLERIAAWEAAGLIDAATAERLRSVEAFTAPDADATEGPAQASRASLVSSFFGPAVSIVEVFSYLGAAFVLAAWGALIGRLSSEATVPTNEWILVAGAAIPAVVFFIIGLSLHGRSPTLDRAAGVGFLHSVVFIGFGVTANLAILVDGTAAWPTVGGAIAALLAALAYRWFHASVLTEVGVLGAITALVAASLRLLDEVLYPASSVIGAPDTNRGVPGVLMQLVAWLGCALVIGLIALGEGRSPGAAAARRAGVARLWAGLVAVVGVAIAISTREFNGVDYARVIEPWIGDVMLLGVAAILLERAFRRESGAYVVAAAFGVVVALTDLNFSYFADAGGTEVALLVEGLLLIGIAIAAERVSRRVGRSPASASPSDGLPEPVGLADPAADANPVSS